MAYTNYDFYVGVYEGTQIDSMDAFYPLSARASDVVDELTRWRVAAYLEAHPWDKYVQKAVCAIAEILQQNERGNSLAASGGSGVIQSEVTSKHHVTYATSTDTASTAGQEAMNAAIRDAAARYLTPTGLMYRGVRRC